MYICVPCAKLIHPYLLSSANCHIKLIQFTQKTESPLITINIRGPAFAFFAFARTQHAANKV